MYYYVSFCMIKWSSDCLIPAPNMILPFVLLSWILIYSRLHNRMFLLICQVLFWKYFKFMKPNMLCLLTFQSIRTVHFLTCIDSCLVFAKHLLCTATQSFKNQSIQAVSSSSIPSRTYLSFLTFQFFPLVLLFWTLPQASVLKHHFVTNSWWGNDCSSSHVNRTVWGSPEYFLSDLFLKATYSIFSMKCRLVAFYFANANVISYCSYCKRNTCYRIPRNWH